MAIIEQKPELDVENLESFRQDGNRFWAGLQGFEARGERIGVRLDEHKSGYECLKCMDKNHHTMEGREVSTLTCEACEGRGKRPKAGNADITVKCSDCQGNGYIPCPDCGGKGTATGIVVPESSKGKPATGIIVTRGPQAKTYELGDRVLFPSYSGHESTVTVTNKKTGKRETVLLRFLDQQDVVAQLYGELEMRSFGGTQSLYTGE